MLEINCNLSSALSQLDNVCENMRKALRPAVYQAADLIYQEAKTRAPMSAKAHNFYGRSGRKYTFQPGSLKKSIYIKHANDKSTYGQQETYVISWRKNSSALGYVPYAAMVNFGVTRQTKRVKRQTLGQQVEYGTVRIPPNPFVRTAYDTKKAQAEQLIIDAIKQAVAQND